MTEESRVVTEETETSWRALLDLTPQVSQTVARAQEEARAMGHRTVETEHELLALFGDEDGITASVFADVGLTAGPVRTLVQERLGPGSGRLPDGQIPFSREATEGLDAASRVAFGVGAEHIGTEHLLLAIVTLLREGGACQIIRALNVDPGVIRFEIKRRVQRPPGPGEDPGIPRLRSRSAELRPRR
jgi:ATP-dependent Clp protease ATP-binding subunit ClpC